MKLPLSVLIVLLAYAGLTALRLPAWHDNLALWTAAAHSDRDNPWALNNLAHHLHRAGRDAEAAPSWQRLVRLRIPDWLPSQERQAYAIGCINYGNMLDAYGDHADAEAIRNYALQIAPTVFGR